ncbi:hypothetical protein KVR01_004583 [Diaporthe batatas]|uniref:uncharacterized protein n=1 Tax=Diaporthe batatas TaxID=748121 RepID=UPI001D041CAF|nr:uncharacterized protein KVR01_004583 [Diaporthe batatas]KAG8166031.1 hypothetical protein KVR01_004583 [Diaporthe batatas]
MNMWHCEPLGTCYIEFGHENISEYQLEKPHRAASSSRRSAQQSARYLGMVLDVSCDDSARSFVEAIGLSSRNLHKPLPANPQGIRNSSFAPPWGSKFTTNINIQMNYWPTVPCHLFECTLPFVNLLERMEERGRKTALAMYGCKGWCAHHNTDDWADTDLQDRAHWREVGIAAESGCSPEGFGWGRQAAHGTSSQGPNRRQNGGNHAPVQIDGTVGNFGGCTGILECLARRLEPTLTGLAMVLPACAEEWEHGELTGLHARDGWIPPPPSVEGRRDHWPCDSSRC